MVADRSRALDAKRWKRILGSLGELAELDPSSATGRKPWPAKKLEAFEKKAKCALPPELRAFLADVGDGGRGFWSGDMAPLEKQNRTALARASAPFPLVQGWVPTSEVAGLKEAGLYRSYKKYLTALPRGARPTDGTLVVGVNEAGERLRVVLKGRFADTVWTDNEGNDFQEFMPSGSSFLDLLEKWLKGTLVAAKKQAKTARSVKATKPGARPPVSGAAMTKYFADLRKQHAEEGADALEQDVALAMFEFYAPKEPEAAGQALLLGELWQKLRDFSQQCLDEGRAAIPFRGPSTHAVHLGLARARLGETKRPTYPSRLAYYHLYSGTVPTALARWSSVELGRALDILPTGFALETLAEFSDAAIERHAKTLRAAAGSLAKRLKSDDDDDEGKEQLAELLARLKAL